MNITVEGTFLFFMNAELLGFLLNLAIKGTIIFAACYLLMFFMKRQSASTRSLVWTFVFAATLLVPFVQMDFPFPATEVNTVGPLPPQSPAPVKLRQDQPDYFARDLEGELSDILREEAIWTGEEPDNPVVTSIVEEKSRWPHWSIFAATAWFIIFIFLALRFIYSIVCSSLISARAKSIEDSALKEIVEDAAKEVGLAGVRVKLTDERLVPFVWGFFRPTLVLTKGVTELDQDRFRAIVLHELNHIRRHDFLRITIINFVAALCWFNPFVWVAVRRARLEMESACDDFVINSGAAAHKYARQLLDFAMVHDRAELSHHGGLAFAQKSTFELRVANIIDGKMKRKPLKGWMAAIFTLVLLLGTTPLTALSLVVDASNEASPELYEAVSSNEDDTDLESLLKWIPQSVITSVEHMDADYLYNGPKTSILKEVYQILNYRFDLSVLPDVMKADLKSLTTCIIHKYSHRRMDVGKDGKHEKLTRAAALMWRNGEKKSEGYGLSVYLADFGTRIYVCRYEDSSAKILEAEKEGRIKKSGKLLDNIPVYNFIARTTNKYERKPDAIFYVLPVSDSEILVAESLQDLENMFDTGTGKLPGLLYERWSEGFKAHWPDSCSTWVIAIRYFFQLDQEKMLALAEYSEEWLSALKRYTHNGEQIKALCYTIEEKPVIRKLIVWGNEEWAAGKGEELRGVSMGYYIEGSYSEQLVDFIESTVSGNVTTEKLVFTDEVIEELKKK